MEPAIEHLPRVKNLAESRLKHQSSEYIQRPRPALTAPRIPATPSPSSTSSLSPPRVATTCTGRSRRHAGSGAPSGPFRVINYGVPKQLLDDVMTAGRSFFGCPKAEKQYSCDPRLAPSEGYGSQMLSKDDGVLDWRDYYDHHTLLLSRRDPGRWPDMGNYRS